MVLPSSARVLIFMVSPLVDGPMMAKTFSSSMSCLANEIAFSGLALESLMMSSTGLPLMPPFLLISCTSISRVRASGPPRLAAGPVTPRMAPSLIVSFASAGVVQPTHVNSSPARILRIRCPPGGKWLQADGSAFGGYSERWFSTQVNQVVRTK